MILIKKQDNMNSKSIFIGGFPQSGKTCVRNLLNKHHEIASLGETKLAGDEIFMNFPIQIFECQPHLRAHLIHIFKQLCTTYLYCHLMFPKGLRRDNAWLNYEKIWLSRLQFPQSLVWNNPLWPILEKLWIPILLEKFICVNKEEKGARPIGWRGLYKFFEKKDIKQCFVHLDSLNDVTTLDEACRIYGDFWNCIFKKYAKKQKKKYWAEESYGNIFHTLFLKRCFASFKFINVFRDGRDVVCSIREKWGKDMRHHLDLWAKTLTITLKDQANMTLNDYINIRYEDLVYNTQITLKKITDFLEVDFDKTMLSLPINSASIGLYKHEFNAELKNYAKDRYGSLLNQWGYPI